MITLVKIDRPFLVLKMSHKELFAIHQFLEGIAPKLASYDATATAVKLNEEIVGILNRYEMSKPIPTPNDKKKEGP